MKVKPPLNERDKRFCEHYLEHFDELRAYREAGFQKHRAMGNYARRKLQQFWAYLLPLQQAKARAVAEKLVISQEAVLRGMAAVAFPPIEEFIQRDEKPLIRKVEINGVTMEEVVTFEGKPVYPSRLKPLHELTPQQLLAVEIFTGMDGRPRYKIPAPKVRHQYLESLGKQMGMFLDKLILEEHQHLHQHAHLHLESVPTPKLERALKELLPIVGMEYARQLGFSVEEYDAAAKGSIVTVEGE